MTELRSPKLPDRLRSLWDCLLERLTTDADRVACDSRSFEAAELLTTTWRQLGERIERGCRLLESLGVRPGDRVGTWSENRLEWIVADLAILGVGGVHVPFHASATAAQVARLAAHAECILILASTRTLGAALRPSESELPQGDVSLSLAQRATRLLDCPVRSIERLAEEETATEVSPTVDELRERIAARAGLVLPPDRMSTLLYTSGTTGRPKGVALGQRQLMANVRDKLAVLPLVPDDVRYALLPFSHIFGRTCDLATWLAVGCRLVVARSKDDWFSEIAACRPTYINAVPLFYDRCRRIAQQRGELDRPGVLRELLGGRIRLCNCGGAPLADAVHDWFASQGVTLVTGYGLTETAPVLTSSSPTRMRRGAVGHPLKQVELRLADDGEVLVRGPNVMFGYYRDPEMTSEVLRDGWFATGDLGTIDDDGYLTLVGRKTELIVTPGGLKIVPTEIERRLVDLDWIEQACVIPDAQGRPGVLLVPARAALARLAPETFRRLDLAAQLPLPIDSETHGDSDEQDRNEGSDNGELENGEIANDAPFAAERAELRRRVLEATADLPKYSRPYRLALEPMPFTVDDETATPKGSLRREAIVRRRSDWLRRWGIEHD